jgi:hypothetical protein
MSGIIVTRGESIEMQAGAHLKGKAGKSEHIPDAVAITGGESPTEAEHNTLVGKVNSILAALRNIGAITDPS